MSTTPSPASELDTAIPKRDALLAEYLDALDVYESQQTMLHEALAAGFLSLATANFHARGVRYGSDYYDQRMLATRGMEVREDGELVARDLNAEEESGKDEDAKEAGEQEGLRRRAGKGEKPEKDEPDKEVETDEKKDAKPAPKPTPRDPLRWFGILVPPALRSAQSSFIEGLEAVYPLLATRHRLEELADKLEGTEDLYKIYTTNPAAGEELPGTELDTESGYVHLCTGSQVVQVVELFMREAEELFVMRIPHEAVAEGLKWEDGFPHFYGHLTRAMGREVGHVMKSEEGWAHAWDHAEWTQL